MAVNFNLSDVEVISRSAKIALSPEEAETVVSDIQHILKMINQLQQINTDEVGDLDANFYALQPSRTDQPGEVDLRQALLSLAPDQEQSLYKVPKVID